MKKIIALLLIVMCVSFVSCGGCNQTSDTLETTGAKTEETKIFYNEELVDKYLNLSVSLIT